MEFSLSEAAAEVGKSKSTIHRAVKSGKLSAKREAGTLRIDAAELFRVFPKASHETVERDEPERSRETEKDVEIRMLRELLEAKNGHIESLERQLARITDQRPQGGLLSRIFGLKD